MFFLDFTSLFRCYFLSLNVFLEVFDNITFFPWLLFLFLCLSLCIFLCQYLDVSDIGVLLDRCWSLISFNIIDIFEVRAVISNGQNGPYILGFLCDLKSILKLILSTISTGDSSIGPVLCECFFLWRGPCQFSLWACMMNCGRFGSIELSCGLRSLECCLWAFVCLIIMEVIFGDLKDPYFFLRWFFFLEIVLTRNKVCNDSLFSIYRGILPTLTLYLFLKAHF